MGEQDNPFEELWKACIQAESDVIYREKRLRCALIEYNRASEAALAAERAKRDANEAYFDAVEDRYREMLDESDGEEVENREEVNVHGKP